MYRPSDEVLSFDSSIQSEILRSEPETVKPKFALLSVPGTSQFEFRVGEIWVALAQILLDQTSDAFAVSTHNKVYS